MKKLYSRFYSKNLLALLTMLCIASASAVAQSYCSPINSTSCSVGGGDYISSVSTTGGSTNISSLNTGCNGNANNYIFYSGQTLTAAAGSTVTLAITIGSFNAEHVIAWIDYNQDYIFDTLTEKVYGSNGTTIAAGGTATATITIPATVTPGQKRLRIRCTPYFYPFSPCGSTLYGETEDYNVMVGAGGSTCMAGVVTSNGAQVCASGGTVCLAISGSTPGSTYQWQVSPNCGVWTNVTGATGINFCVAQSVTTCYRAIVACQNGSVATTPWFTVQMSGNCQDSVWPGDANYDHIANNLDILAIGTAYGLTGPVRSTTGIVWQPDFAMDWSTNFNSGVNKKNADCNGDGIVNWSDTLAVSTNYGLTHPKGTDESAERGAGLPDLKVDLTGLNLLPGNTYSAPVRFGSSSSPVPKIYGIAATLKCSGVTMQAAPSLSFSASWLGNMNKLVYLSHPVNAGNVDFAIVRNTHRDTTGFGILGTVTFKVPANATGRLIFGFQNVTVIDSNGNTLTGYNVMSDTANIQSTGVNILSSAASFEASIAPNPGHNSTLHIESNLSGVISLNIYDATGRKTYESAERVQKGSNSISLLMKELPAGFYTIRMSRTDDAVPVLLKWIKE